MKFRFIFSLVIFLGVLVNPTLSFAQKESIPVQVHRIELKDGSVIIGTILAEYAAAFKFRTLSDVEMVIEKDQILKMELISGRIVKGRLWRKDPNQTRLLFAPTARTLKKGQGYFSVYEIFFPMFAFGVTDFFSLAVGGTLVPGAEEQLFYIAPKISPVHFKSFDVGAGVLYINIPDEEGAGIVYGVTTYSRENFGLTLGLGYGFEGGDFAQNPIIVLGGEFQLSNTVKIISENWFITGSESDLISFGIRFFGKNLAADFGLIYPTGSDMEGFPFVPWIGFAYNFGPKR